MIALPFPLRIPPLFQLSPGAKFMANLNIDELRQQARAAVAQRDYELARQIYLQILSLQPEEPDVHYGLATVFFLLNELDSAAYHFKKVTKLDPMRAAAHINLGAVYNRLDRLDDALEELRRGIHLDPHRSEGYYNLGLVYRRKGQLNMAIHAYMEAVRVNPRMADAHYNLANLYLGAGKPAQAAHHYREALTLHPGWEKAQAGLTQAEEAMEAEEPAEAVSGLPQTAAKPAPAVKAGQGTATLRPPLPAPATTPQRNLDQLVDPYKHGVQLAGLHRAIIETDTYGQALQEVLEKQVEPAIKELSTSLLNPDSPLGQLDERLQKFESALKTVQAAHRDLENSLVKVRTDGDRLLDEH